MIYLGKNYQINELIYDSQKSLVYRGIRISDRQQVIIKLIKSNFLNIEELSLLQNQFNIMKNIDLRSVLKVINFKSYQNDFILILEDFGESTLDRYFNDLKLQLSIDDIDGLLGKFFPIAIQIAESLGELYSHGIVHKDIKPANIQIDVTTQLVKLNNFSHAIRSTGAERGQSSVARSFEGTLAYASPEQTGRIDRGIDYRSDYYSLGVTFYQLLTGKLPFEVGDPIELIHSHLTKLAVPIHAINSLIPQALSEIVAKLMAKNVEDRYQSALGLKRDLEYCWLQWQSTGKIERFELGKKSLSDRLLIPEKLYGREVAVQLILNSVERLIASAAHSVDRARGELLLLSGFFGVGKTAVINEAYKLLCRQKVYVTRSDFSDETERNVPFSAFVRAFRSSIEQLSREDDERLARYKERILSVVGDRGQILIDRMPELEQIIGKQSPIGAFPEREDNNLFKLLFQKFTDLFAVLEQPLVIFLDNVQWIDEDSLELLEILMQKGRLLIICAYRDNELSGIHPMMMTVNQLKQQGIIVNNIILSSLSTDHINELVAESFNCSIDAVRPLAELVDRKTNGNPFFVIKFLKSLECDSLVKFNSQIESWECDLSQIKIQSLTNDEIDLMATQLQQLPTSTQQMLQLAACLGIEFDVSTLVTISQLSDREVVTILLPALQAGALVPLHETYSFFQLLVDIERVEPATVPAMAITYRFSHERVREAAYSLIPEAERATFNYRIGEFLLADAIASTDGNLPPTLNIYNMPLSELDWVAIEEVNTARLLPIVELFDRGGEYAAECGTQLAIVRLNLIASCRARASKNYRVALKYAQHGIELLRQVDWQQDSELAFAIHELAIELAALCGEFGFMQQWIDATISQPHPPLKLVEIYLVQIQSLVAQNLPIEAIGCARTLLSQMDVRLSADPTLLDIERAMQEIDDLILTRSIPIEALADLPIISDPQQLEIVRVASSIMLACYITNPLLYALVVALQVNLSIRYGTSDTSAYSYAAYGILVNHYRQDVTCADRFGHLAASLAALPHAGNIRSVTLAVIGLFLHHRTAHLSTTIPILQAGYQAGLAAGQLDNASHQIAGLCANAYWCGDNLRELRSQLVAYRQQLLELVGNTDVRQSQLATDYLTIYDETALVLLGNPDNVELTFNSPFAKKVNVATEAEPPQSPTPIIRQRVADEAEILAGKDLLRGFLFYFHRAILRFLAGDLAAADADVQCARGFLSSVTGLIYEAGFYFYDSLIALAAEPLKRDDLAACQTRIRANQQQLAHWAKYAPMNHLHKWQLVEAETSRRSGDKATAIDFYDRAIAGATANDYVQEAALANELAAKFYLAWGKDKIATDYLQAAHDRYTQWGATAKLADLIDRYSQLSIAHDRPLLAQSTPNYHLELLSAPNLSMMDLNAHIKAIQGLSSEIDLDRLLRTLMDVVVENAGADRAALLLNQDGKLTIAIEYDDGDLDTLDFDLHSFDREYRLPLFLIRHVHRTQTTEIYNGSNNPYLNSDPYFEENQPQSILCVPILNQSRLIGILYLENTLTSGVFSHDRVELLNIICTQAAISLENARLHQSAQAYAQKLEQSLLDLQCSETRLSTVANNIPGAIAQLCIDPARTVAELRYISSGCYELYEVTATEMIEGKYSLRHFEHPADRPQIDLAIQASQQHHGAIKIENRIVTPSGKEKWIQLAASSLEPQLDGTFLTECTILDISDRKQVEIQLQTTNEELLRSNRLKDQFLANMSHELRTPLNAILGMTEGLQEQVFGSINAEQLVALNTVEHSSTHLLALINDILELAKIEAGQLEINCAPTEIEPLCQSSLIFIKQLAFQKQIQVDVEIPPNLPNLLVDERRIRQVLINLLNNAVKFTPAGGQVSLDVAYLDTPDSTAGAGQQRIAISISDTGIGISPDNIKKLFQPFIQIDGALNRQFEGTGLGLALVKRIIDLHHGEVELSSELGLGSCFTVRLPCEAMPPSAPKRIVIDRPSNQLAASADLLAVEVSRRIPARAPLILLVEDNDANINTMSSYLNAKGYQIALARSGREAIEQTREIDPDIILMDIQMPVMDGLTATQQIREFSDIPIIALTALATNEDRENCMKAGANDYFSKPVKLKHLTTVIDRCLTDLN